MIIRILFITLLAALSMPAAASEADVASPMERVYLTQVKDTVAPHELRLDVDGLLFFRNDEFTTPLSVGYTLPGFRLRPALSYRPTRNVKLELGLYALRYWGTDEYPNMAYRDIARWTGTTSRGFHLLPLFRATMSTGIGLDIVLGTLYGGANHRLPEPMYAPELNLTADPEAGVQLLLSRPRLDVDMWLNWESFIYRGDTHQEAFVFGLSSCVGLTRPGSRVKVSAPLSVLVQHRGGEIDTLYTNSMQTLMNASAGVAVETDFGRRCLGKAGVAAYFLGYKQVAGELWPYKSGSAWYLRGYADVGPVRLKLGWYRANRFISLMGYPLFGTVSATASGEVFGTTSTAIFGAEYSYEFAPGYRLGVDFDFYHQPKSTGWAIPTGEYNSHSPSNSYCFGIYMRVNPSFLLKKWNKNN